MKHGKKIALWTLLGVTLLGLVLAGTGMALGASPYLDFGPEGIQVAGSRTAVEGELEIGPFTDLTLTANTADIELIPSDHYAVAYRVEEEAAIPSAQHQGERLILSQQGRSGFRINLGFFPSGQDPYIRVYYDASRPLGAVDLSLACGDATLTGVDAESLAITSAQGNVVYKGRANALSFTLSCGDLTLAAQAEMLQMNVSLGDVQMKDCSLDSLTGTLACGSLTANGTIGQSHLTLNLGDFTFTGGEIGNVTYQGDCGSCVVEGKLTGNNSFALDMGDLTIRSSLPRDQYHLDLSCDMGEARVNGGADQGGQDAQAPYGIQARVSAGDIEANFLS